MTLRLDYTAETVLVICSLCPGWFAFAYCRPDGWTLAALHEVTCHPDLRQARAAAK